MNIPKLIKNHMHMNLVKEQDKNNMQENNKGEDMEVSKLTLTDEFIKKTKKKLGPQEKGRLRWERLVRADKDGTLQSAKKRIDIGKIAGIMDDRNAYCWTANMIQKGAITETLMNYENGKATYEYHLGKPLKYESGRKSIVKRAQQEKKIIEKQESEPITKTIKVEYSDSRANVTININSMTIAIEDAPIDYLVALIKELSK